MTSTLPSSAPSGPHPGLHPGLRPYQRAAVEAVLAARRAGKRRLLVHLPTGAGKTVIFSHLAQLARRQVLVLAHREELLTQARDKLERALGGAAGASVVAIERGGLRAPPDARVLVCSIRSLHEERLAKVLRGRDVGLIVYDECHHATAEDNLRVLRQLGVFEPTFTGTLLGFTATTSRGDGQGLEQVFEEIVYSRDLPELIEDGFLAPMRGYRIATTADLRQLSSSGTGLDFDEEQLAEAVDIEERNALVARSIQELARDRRTIAFCVTVNHARHLAHALNALGVPAGIVHGAMPGEARAQALADFRAGRVQVLTNVGVLTEGFDDPGVSCVAMARPTRSEGFYAQCVGRGTRLHPGKADCLVLDFVDLTELSLCTLPSLFGTPRDLDLRGGDASEARRAWLAIAFDRPGFELEAGAVTLAEIQDRAASFDPLTPAHTRGRARHLQPRLVLPRPPRCRPALPARGPRQRGAGRAPRRPRQVLGGRHGRQRPWSGSRAWRRPSRPWTSSSSAWEEGRFCRPPRRPRGDGPRRRSLERREVRAPRTSPRRCA